MTAAIQDETARTRQNTIIPTLYLHLTFLFTLENEAPPYLQDPHDVVGVEPGRVGDQGGGEHQGGPGRGLALPGQGCEPQRPQADQESQADHRLQVRLIFAQNSLFIDH